MQQPVPIACTLSTDGLSERLEEMRAVGRSGLVAATVDGGSAILRFRDEQRLRERLEAIVAGESECCAFLAMDLRHGGQHLELSVRGPAEAEEIIRDMVRAFSGEPSDD